MFQKLASIFCLSLFLVSCSTIEEEKFEIEINSNRIRGHQVRSADTIHSDTIIYIKTVVIGGGAAGVSSYTYLDGKDVALIEMNSFLGGSAAGGNHKATRFANGAHYDLIYPNNYGENGLALLEKANVINYDEFNKRYHFVDYQFLVNTNKESTCWRAGEIYKDPLDGFEELEIFKQLLMPFANKMVMPTNLIHDSLWYLNEINFGDWLSEQHNFSVNFKNSVSYQMRDDWGGGMHEISALSGIHYYMCRPYYDEEIELLSPPEGNLYFIEKLLATTGYENIYTSNMCVRIVRKDLKWSVFTMDFEKGICREFICDEIIYAGQKHALQYIAPNILHQESPEYSNWISVNLILKPSSKDNAFWQNDVIGMNEHFMGFSNSYAQFDYTDDNQVLTAYYCFSSDERQELVRIEENSEVFVDSTIAYIEKVLGNGIYSKIEKVNINFLGHAMPLPKVNYLQQDYNELRKYNSFTFAGVDTGRLPLFFEALESGIQAVDALRNDSISKQL